MYYAGLTYAQIARKEGIGLTTVWRRIHALGLKRSRWRVPEREAARVRERRYRAKARERLREWRRKRGDAS